MQRKARLGLVALSTLSLLAGSGTASASHRPGHPCVAAVCQYVEQLPTSSGSKPTGVGKITHTALPSAIKQRLVEQAGADAPLLEEISTSSAYGAPQSKANAKDRGGSGRGSKGPGGRSDPAANAPVTKDPSLGGALSAAVNVTADGSDGRLIGLLIVLLGITGVAVAAAGLRQRTARDSVRH